MESSLSKRAHDVFRKQVDWSKLRESALRRGRVFARHPYNVWGGNTARDCVQYFETIAVTPRNFDSTVFRYPSDRFDQLFTGYSEGSDGNPVTLDIYHLAGGIDKVQARNRLTWVTQELGGPLRAVITLPILAGLMDKRFRAGGGLVRAPGTGELVIVSYNSRGGVYGKDVEGGRGFLQGLWLAAISSKKKEENGPE